MIILLATDVLLKGVWETVAELKDPELCRLASALPDTVLKNGYVKDLVSSLMSVSESLNL